MFRDIRSQLAKGIASSALKHHGYRNGLQRQKLRPASEWLTFSKPFHLCLVRRRGLEPLCLAALAPQPRTECITGYWGGSTP
jgi:hypothetical protein